MKDAFMNRQSVSLKFCLLGMALVLVMLNGIVSAQEKCTNDPKIPWKDCANPGVLILDEDDPTGEFWRLRRDTVDDVERKPGLVSVQRYESGLSSFPSFFGAPLAFTPEDLKAGEVDVAIIGAPTDGSNPGGTSFAPNTMRLVTAGDPYMPSTLGDRQGSLKIADYGNIAINMLSVELSTEEIRKTVGEVLSADVIPIVIGGSHDTQYGVALAVADKYGDGEVGLIHIDAHSDSIGFALGFFTHLGNGVRNAVKYGLIKGENVVQFGLNDHQGSEVMNWFKEQGVRYHYMDEIRRDGFDEALARALAEVRIPTKLYISMDIDVTDHAYAPGVAKSVSNGLLPVEVFRLLRALAIQNEVVAIEFIEYNPYLDDRVQTTGQLLKRMMRNFLTGLELKKQGILDPHYRPPELLDDGRE
jgi:arginase family enzyme